MRVIVRNNKSYKPCWRNMMAVMDDSQAGGSGGGALPAPITYVDPLLSSSPASFVSIWGNTFTLKANGERPDGITDIEWAGYLTEQEMKRPGVTDAQDVIFARQMNIIAQQNVIAADAAAQYAAAVAAQTAQNAADAVQQQIYAEQIAAQAAADAAAALQAQNDARTAAEAQAASIAAAAAQAVQAKADADAAQANIELIQRQEAARLAIQAQEAAEAKLRAEQLQIANDAAAAEAARLQQVARTAAELAAANQAVQEAVDRAILIKEAQRQADIAVAKAGVQAQPTMETAGGKWIDPLLTGGTKNNIPVTKTSTTQPLAKTVTQAGMAPVYIVGALAVAGFLTWILRKKK